MNTDIHKRALELWRQDLRRTNYFETRKSELRQDDETPPMRGPYDVGVHFRGRVMWRLNRRGYKLKEIAHMFGLASSQSVFRALHVDMIEIPSKSLRKYWVF